MTDLITAGEAARLLGITVNLFRQWVKRGKVAPAQKVTARLWLYDRTTVEQLRKTTGGGA
jgi:DNA-binding transcriptional MerR regulator